MEKETTDKNRGSLSISSMRRDKTQYLARLGGKAFVALMYIN